MRIFYCNGGRHPQPLHCSKVNSTVNDKSGFLSTVYHKNEPGLQVKWLIPGLEQGVRKVSLEYLIVQKVRMCPNTNVDIQRPEEPV